MNFKKEIEDLVVKVMGHKKGSDDGVKDFMSGHFGKSILL
jgi:hypothetical protein